MSWSKSLVLALAFTTITFAQNAAQTNVRRAKTKVDVRYDKGSDTTTVRLAPLTVINSGDGNERENLDFAASFSYPKQTIVTPKSVNILIFSFYAGGAGFEEERRLIVSIDGMQMDLGNMDLKRERSYGDRLNYIASIEQDLELAISFADFLKISKANKVSVAVGRKKFSLNTKQMQSLRDFADLMQQEGETFGP